MFKIRKFVWSAQERSALTDTRLNEALESIENQAYVLNTLRGSLEDTNSNMAASLDRTDTIDLRLKTLSERVGSLADLEGRFATRAALKAVEERLQQVAEKPAAAPKDLEERLGGLAVSCKNLGMTVGDVKSRGDHLEGMFKEISQQLESLEELPKQGEELKSLQSKVGVFLQHFIEICALFSLPRKDPFKLFFISQLQSQNGKQTFLQFNQHKAKLIDVEAMVTFQERTVNKLGNMATRLKL